MLTRKRITGQEKLVASRWQELLGKELTAEEGQRLRIIYPGRVNNDTGPDYRDATVVVNEELLKGDVEVHFKSSDWYSHGHDNDPGYNKVILHLVGWHDGDPTLLQNGRLVPVLCLSPNSWHGTYPSSCHLPCSQILSRRCERAVMELLNIAGRERFEQKARNFRVACLQDGVGQVLFRGMMRALGYSKNVKPFEELSDRVPLSFLEGLEPGESLSLKQAWLLGTAGLLPSQSLRGWLSREGEIRELELIWQSIGRGVETMSRNDWRFSHVYPNNSPLRRLVAITYLLQRYHKTGLLTGILELIKTTSLAAGHDGLENGLILAGNDYWQEHFDIGGKTRKSVLLGQGKASEITVNILLPFAFFCREIANEPELREKALDFYLHYPKLAENEITRHMAKQLRLEDASCFTACHQQGLIHIYKCYCCEGNCSQCPLAN